MILPDRIVIFQRPLQALARDEAHPYELVRHTVHHEIAHHFGISDARPRELGLLKGRALGKIREPRRCAA